MYLKIKKEKFKNGAQYYLQFIAGTFWVVFFLTEAKYQALGSAFSI